MVWAGTHCPMDYCQKGEQRKEQARGMGATFYRKPTRLARIRNRFMSWLASLGLTPSDTVTLEVRGRRSGRTRSAAVTLVELEAQRYLVSPRGESHWVRNLRAAGGHAAIRRRGRQKVRLEEVPAGQRAPILQKYFNRWTIAGRQRYFGLAPNAGIEEFERIAARYPVFRILSTTG